MTSYDIEFTSTPEERYDTDLVERTRQALAKAFDMDPERMDSWGGSGSDFADNGFCVVSDLHISQVNEIVKGIITDRPFSLWKTPGPEED